MVCSTESKDDHLVMQGQVTIDIFIKIEVTMFAVISDSDDCFAIGFRPVNHNAVSEVSIGNSSKLKLQCLPS